MQRLLPALFALLISANAFAEGKCPDFNLKDLDGKKFKLSEQLKQGPILVDFWATWCSPCVKELPHIQAINKKFTPKGLQVVAISIDNPKSQSKVTPLVKAAGYTFRVLQDPDNAVRKLFGGADIPLTLLVDGKGEIVFRHLGYSAGDEKVLEAEVAKLFAASGDSSAVKPPAGK